MCRDSSRDRGGRGRGRGDRRLRIAVGNVHHRQPVIRGKKQMRESAWRCDTGISRSPLSSSLQTPSQVKTWERWRVIRCALLHLHIGHLCLFLVVAPPERMQMIRVLMEGRRSCQQPGQLCYNGQG